jgi:hypothetical protein
MRITDMGNDSSSPHKTGEFLTLYMALYDKESFHQPC